MRSRFGLAHMWPTRPSFVLIFAPRAYHHNMRWRILTFSSSAHLENVDWLATGGLARQTFSQIGTFGKPDQGNSQLLPLLSVDRPGWPPDAMRDGVIAR